MAEMIKYKMKTSLAVAEKCDRELDIVFIRSERKIIQKGVRESWEEAYDDTWHGWHGRWCGSRDRQDL